MSKILKVAKKAPKATRPSVEEADGGAFEVFKKTITICANDATANGKRLHALLRSSDLPEKYHDKDLKKLDDMGALPILRKILMAGLGSPVFSGTPFARVVDKCATTKRRIR